ncbi:unnamed protein product [Psylliodes chrysocephalus]|uniref:EGF-like domain-containing protein n=1 Tax=Psylliodes chrysocephalus TaxID=3402493 RepID=A0A9P0CWG4_9CUCU|nr:unnamed protein product [Psylliodes chrysocephala]
MQIPNGQIDSEECEGCEESDCEDPTCSEHGACVHGQCYCKAGWKGAHCDIIDEQVHKCLPTCSDHGVYDLEAAKCVCNRHWTGQDCSQGKRTRFRLAGEILYRNNYPTYIFTDRSQLSSS